MAYCSEACQEQDWLEFHSRECPPLTLQFIGEYETSLLTTFPWLTDLIKISIVRKEHRAWPSFKAKWDQIRYLEALANMRLPPPDELRNPNDTAAAFENIVLMKHPYPVVAYNFHPDSVIVSCDFVTNRYLTTCFRYPLKLHLYDSWGHPSYQCWQPRIQRYVADMEANPNLILMESVTQYDAGLRILTFMTLKYSANAPKGHKYTVVNAVSRIG